MINIITNWDLQVIHFVNSFSSPVLDTFFKCITNTAGFKFMAIFIILLLAYRQTRRLGGQLLMAELLQLALGGYFLKHLIARPRPFIVDSTIELITKAPNSYSCPSGHTSTAFALAFVLLYTDCPKFIKLLVLLWAVIIGFSRLYLQVHFPTDVLLGAILGCCCGYIATYLNLENIRNTIISDK